MVTWGCLMTEKSKKESENPPFLKTWKNFYMLVLGNLIVLLILFYLFTGFFE